MARRKRMWIDVDEVLADFQGAVFEVVERLFGRKMTAYDFDGWDLFSTFPPEERAEILRECERPGFCANLRQIPDAREALTELRKHVDLYAVTSPFHSITWVHERDWWLQQHMGFQRTEIAYTAAKYLIVADACLDDRPENVIKWKAAHPQGLAMIWPVPNTSNLPLDDYRVRDWDDVIRRVVEYEV